MKKTLTFKLSRGNEYNEVFNPSKTLTIGNSYKNDIVGSYDFLPESYCFYKNHKNINKLYLLKGMNGSYTSSGTTISIRKMIETNVLAKEKEYHILIISGDAYGCVELGDTKIDFNYTVTKQVKKKIQNQ